MSNTSFTRPPVPSVTIAAHAWETTIVVDIDGVISPDPDLVPGKPEALSLEQSEFVQTASAHLQELVSRGHSIILWTSRPWTALEETKAFLKHHNIPHSGLLMGKPRAALYIDDRAHHFQGWPGVMDALSQGREP